MGTINLNHTGVIALTMPISGPGSVTQIGNGTTSLTASSSFAGPLNVHAGLLEISVGGQVNNAADSNVANGVGQVASVRINGAGSKWIDSASTFIGSIGTGTVTVENGGEFADTQILVNRFANGNGTLTVTGEGSKAITLGELRVADEGVGLVCIEAGGSIQSGNAYLAHNLATANGTAVISGSGSLWTINGFMDVGNLGMGAGPPNPKWRESSANEYRIPWL